MDNPATAAVSAPAEVLRQAAEAAQPTYHISPEGRHVAGVRVWTARAESSAAAAAVGCRMQGEEQGGSEVQVLIDLHAPKRNLARGAVDGVPSTLGHNCGCDVQ